MKQKTFALTVVAMVLISCCATSANALQMQMEVRKSDLFDPVAFAKAKPAVGEIAPDIQLRSLNGKAVALSSFRGKNVVIVKAGYT